MNMLAIGAVYPNSARIWMRSDSAGPVCLRYWPEADPTQARKLVVEGGAEAADRTVCATLPGNGEAPLEPSTPYRVEAFFPDSEREIGSGRFETSPADAQSAPDRFAIAFMSCNQPFTEDGRESDHGAAMLTAAASCLEQHSVKLVFTLGDQMYTDYPQRTSLFDRRYFERVRPRPELAAVTDASIQEIRSLLHMRYRYFWNTDGWKRMHALHACYPAIDDHEIVDNWGCHPDHATEQWRPYIEGARAAYVDYQGCRVQPRDRHPDSFDYTVEYGPVAAYIFDLRSNRRTDDSARILSRRQFERFSGFLGSHADKEAVLIGLSVPIVHLPRWAAKAGRLLTLRSNEDFSDRWSTAGHVRDRDRILSILRGHQRAHPSQQVFCLSGDIHIACAHRIFWDDGTPPLTQLISSGITHHVGHATQAASKLSILANRRIQIDDDGATGGDVALINGEPSCNSNPYTKLNLGMLEFRRNPDGRYDTRSLIYGHRGDEPHCVFRTPWNERRVPGPLPGD